MSDRDLVAAALAAFPGSYVIEERRNRPAGGVRYEGRITRPMLQAERGTLFVFGDNLQRRGRGGQAAEMRGEPNAVGIPTKRAPSMDDSAFFTDADFDDFRDAAAPAFALLRAHAEGGGAIVWPADGVGTGLGV
ncbi:hypothetical protein E4V01_25170 [Methylorubrum sp. Q1]|uniref:DUF7831 domain-containing protein n=1 Tax=Methylorubrum sp. Q1 TaxID=2562453 RepID=UPI001076430F|nr:hypothetical protein [Methylorubrum sp. Q1]TFZ54475.1 hypothetical protein E4V01_25170 [Methylorubrum sp. Q1]